MRLATRHFKSLGYDVEDTSSNNPFDLQASRREEILYVEVKGTTGAGQQVFLTANEVKWAQQHPKQMVFVVSAIAVVENQEGPRGSGGETRVVWPWDVDTGELRAISYQYGLPGGGKS